MADKLIQYTTQDGTPVNYSARKVPNTTSNKRIPKSLLKDMKKRSKNKTDPLFVSDEAHKLLHKPNLRSFQMPVIFPPRDHTIITSSTGFGKTLFESPFYMRLDGRTHRQPTQTFEPCQWRKYNLSLSEETNFNDKIKKHLTTGHKVPKTKPSDLELPIQVDWCYKFIAGYYVVLVKDNGMIGISYCNQVDAKPHFNPEKSIKLAYERRKFSDRIKWTWGIEAIEFYAIMEYMMMGNSSCPHKVVRHIRKLLHTVSFGVK